MVQVQCHVCAAKAYQTLSWRVRAARTLTRMTAWSYASAASPSSSNSPRYISFPLALICASHRPVRLLTLTPLNLRAQTDILHFNFKHTG